MKSVRPHRRFRVSRHGDTRKHTRTHTRKHACTHTQIHTRDSERCVSQSHKSSRGQDTSFGGIRREATTEMHRNPVRFDSIRLDSIYTQGRRYSWGKEREFQKTHRLPQKGWSRTGIRHGRLGRYGRGKTAERIQEARYRLLDEEMPKRRYGVRVDSSRPDRVPLCPRQMIVSTDLRAQLFFFFFFLTEAPTPANKSPPKAKRRRENWARSEQRGVAEASESGISVSVSVSVPCAIRSPKSDGVLYVRDELTWPVGWLDGWMDGWMVKSPGLMACVFFRGGGAPEMGKGSR